MNPLVRSRPHQLMLVLLLSLTACKKDNQDPINGVACKLIRTVFTGSTGTVSSATYEYDTNDLLSRLSYSADKEVLFEYNHHNQLIKTSDRLNSSTVVIKQYEYNSEGQWIKSLYQAASGLQITTVTYDEEGNRTMIEQKDPNGATLQVTFQYLNGNLIESVAKESANVTNPPFTTRYDYFTDKVNQQKVLQDRIAPFFNEATATWNLPRSINYNFSTSSTLYTYEFNEQGYPTKQSWAFTAANSQTTSFEYQCK